MFRINEQYESSGLKPGWLLYYIIETYHLNRFRENIKSISGKFGQDLMTS